MEIILPSRTGSYTNTSEDNTGLFGYVSASLIQNIALEGTWALTCASNSGFLFGTMGSSSNAYNISADFSSGSIVCTGDNIGGMIGRVMDSSIQGLTLKGSLSHITGKNNVAGAIGSISNSDLNYARNLIQFIQEPAISGTICGGICGQVLNSNVIYIMNAMNDRIHSGYRQGGGDIRVR